jgi:hypothetical protein
MTSMALPFLSGRDAGAEEVIGQVAKLKEQLVVALGSRGRGQ